MKTVKQDYFDRFKCIADKCPCTCCSGWQIMVDEDSLDRFSKYRGELKDNVNNSIDWIEGAILQCENGDCAFLCEDGLCELIKAEGEDILCDTCRLYPRHVEEYEDLREWSMSLSCPEVAMHFVKRTDPVCYVVCEDDEPDELEDEFEDFDIILFDKLLESRQAMTDILRRKELSLGEKVGLISEMSERLQHLFDEDEVFQMDDVIEEFKDEAFIKENAKEYEISFAGFIREDFEVLYELERLSEDWDKVLDMISLYPFKDADSMPSFIEGVTDERHGLISSNILESLIYTYYPGAIYNGMIYGYLQMCIFAAVSIDALALCKSIKEGRKITLDEYAEVVYLYSRETEHSDINIGMLLEYFDGKI